MSDRFTEIFGLILVGTAFLLAAWEYHAWRGRYGENFLLTRPRMRRRVLIAAVLASIGVLITLESRGTFPTNEPGNLIVFAIVVLILSVLLVILAGVDAVETVRRAADETIRDASRPSDARGPDDGGPHPDDPRRDGPE